MKKVNNKNIRLCVLRVFIYKLRVFIYKLCDGGFEFHWSPLEILEQGLILTVFAVDILTLGKLTWMCANLTLSEINTPSNTIPVF